MQLSAAFLKWGVHRFLRGRGPELDTYATRSWEVCPAEIQLCPPAVYLPESLDRVQSSSPWRAMEDELRYIHGGRFEHSATRACLVENIYIEDSFLYRGHSRSQRGYIDPGHRLRRNSCDSSTPRHLEEAHLVSSWAGCRFFGLFMRADLPLELLPEQGAPLIALPTKTYEHASGYRNALQIPTPLQVRRAHVSQLILYTDAGQNKSKAERYSKLRQNLRQTLSRPTHAPPGVYLRRGPAGEHRKLNNEAEIEKVLSDIGFDIVDSAALSAEEVSLRLLDTPIIVSIEGSHLAHAIYSIADQGSFLVLQPPDRLAMAYKEFTDRMDMRFAFTVGHPAADGFVIRTDELRRTLDLLQ